MQPLHSLIREVIAQIGRPAPSSLIVRRLRQRGLRLNCHTVMKQLAVPRFELTSPGWRNELRQAELFPAEDAA